MLLEIGVGDCSLYTGSQGGVLKSRVPGGFAGLTVLGTGRLGGGMYRLLNG